MREAIASLFLYLLKIYHMKLINYLLIALVFVSSCKEEEVVSVQTFAKDYGKGMYVVTDNGVSFYDGEVVKSQIYKNVNGGLISNPKKIIFNSGKAYVIGNEIFITDAETFQDKGLITGFSNVVDLNIVSFNRLFAVDKGASMVKVVDLSSLEIITDIETGDSTNPVFAISNWYRTYVLNGGAVADSLKDSTIIAIDYKDGAIPLADFMGSIPVGDNPNSAIWNGNLKVLCGGVFDSTNSLVNTESSLYNINPWDVEVDWSETLNGIYNARGLIENSISSRFYFLANSGVYWMPQNATYTTQITPMESDILLYKIETFAVNDTTNAQSAMLYLNDAVASPNTIYRYNLLNSTFSDTIIFDGPVKDIVFY